MVKNIVIIGGSYAGTGVAHKLLKHTYPKTKDFKVTLVSTSSHFYWTIAAVRAVVPGQLADDKVYQAIAPGFAKYPEGSFEFIEGTATKVDTAAKTVVVGTGAGEQTLSYDHLVITTGSSFEEHLPFKQYGTYQQQLDSLHAFQARVKDAKSIVIGGAGPTGTETAGELGFEYKDKEITLTSTGEHAIPILPSHVGATADMELKKLGVKIIPNVKVTSYVSKGTQTEITLSNGTVILADLFIPAYGVVPNTSFLPAELLDAERNLKVDLTLKVEGVEDVWAAGDVSNLQRKQIMFAELQLIHLSKNLDAVLTGGKTTEYKPNNAHGMGVTLGRSKGTGYTFGFKFPSFVIWWVKGRTLSVEKMDAWVNGVSLIINGKI